MKISELVKRSHEIAVSKGWYKNHRNKSELLMLMVTELAEACEALRHPDRPDDHLPHLDPVGVELADCVIRIADYCGAHNIDLQRCISEKMAYNESRSERHGGKAF